MAAPSLLLSCLVLTCVLATYTCMGYERHDDAVEEFSQDSGADIDVSSIDTMDDGSTDVMQLGGDDLEEFSGCRCNKRTGCECCERVSFGYLFAKFKLRACIRMSLLKGGGAYLIYNLNGRNLFFNRVNLKRLPRPCRKVPKLPGFLTRSKVCLDFYNVNAAKRTLCSHITGYIKLPFKLLNVYKKLGCITLPKRTEVDTEITPDTIEDLGEEEMPAVDEFDEVETPIEGLVESVGNLKEMAGNVVDLNEIENDLKDFEEMAGNFDDLE